MALLFMESFDHLVTGDLVAKGWTYDAGASVVGTGRFGNGGYLGDERYALLRVIGTHGPTLIVGAAVKPAGWSAVAYESQWLAFLRSGTEQISVRCDTTTGYLAVCRNSTTPIKISTYQIPAGVWTYLELKVTLATGSTGSYEVRANGQTIMSDTNVVTATTAAEATQVNFDGNRPGGITYDDIYVCNGSGTTNNDFLGDVRVQAIIPSGAGNYSQWTSASGDANYQNVDDGAIALADGTNNYNSSLTSLQKDTFTYGNLTPTSGTVYGVQYNLGARKDDAGTRIIAPMSRQSSSDYVSATTHSISNSYTYYSQIKETNPATGVAWTIDDINTNSEFGYRLES